MLYFALPPLMVPVPNVVLPSVKVTVPVAVSGPTVAVNVTKAPREEGFREEVSVTEEADLPNPVPEKAIQTKASPRTRNIFHITYAPWDR